MTTPTIWRFTDLREVVRTVPVIPPIATDNQGDPDGVRHHPRDPVARWRANDLGRDGRNGNGTWNGYGGGGPPGVGHIELALPNNFHEDVDAAVASS